MTQSIPVEEADRLLDELDDLAQSDTSNVEFNDHLLDRLRFLVGSQSAAILTVLQPDRWVMLSRSGQIPEAVYDEFRNQFARNPISENWQSTDTLPSWYAYALRSDRTIYGCLLLTFSGPLPASVISTLEQLTVAFGEIISLRHHKHLERIFGKHWIKLYELNAQLTQCSSPRDAGIILVNSLVPILAATRISLASAAKSTSLKGVELSVVSGVSSLDRSSQTAKNLEQVAGEALNQKQPIVRRVSTVRSQEGDHSQAVPLDDGIFSNLMALRFFLDENRADEKKDIIIIEWSNDEDLLDAIPAIPNFLPSLCTVWQQQQRWLRIPRVIRSFPGWGPTGLIRPHTYRWLRPLMFLGVFLIGAWWLMRPYPLTIEADAVLEPISRRAIHASADGFIEELFVEDGQRVQKNQKLVRLRSPALDLQIEETLGQKLAFAEKRNGLRVAVNQLSPSSPDSSAAQTRLSADIMLLETQEKLANEKLTFLMNEKSKLTIESPIEGVIVSRDLRRELEFRPLRRGDALFGIADLEGDWQLNTRVADRDSGYVLDNYGDTDKEVSFVLNSNPQQHFYGKVTKISSVMESGDREESFLPVFVHVEKGIAKKSNLGANAKAFFHCGSQPTWFVWCRPLVETIQKRVWLFFDGQPKSTEDSRHVD